MYQRLVIILGLICINIISWGQIPSNPLGNNALQLDWRKIDTDKVRVIFPEGMESQATRVTNLVHSLWQYDTPSIGRKTKKASLVLHSQNAQSNGFVTVAPFRSELFVIAPQFDCSTNWLDHLTIHEYQHIKQFNNSRKGITGLVKVLFGDWAWGGMMGLAMPRWYFEGDAVIAETALTQSGRGRLPRFTMEYKSLYDSGINYNYEKATAGSLQDYVPNWYNFGYHFLSYGRQEYGPGIWTKVTDDAVRYKGILYPFKRSLQKQTGKTPKEFYKLMMEDLHGKFDIQYADKEFMQGIPVNKKRKRTVTHYSAPQYLANNSLVVQKSGYDQNVSLVHISSDGNEKKIVTPGFFLDRTMSTYSVQNKKIAWAELGWDLRRRYRRFSEIVVFDSSTKQKRRLTKNSYYYSPSLSKDASQVLCLHLGESLKPDIQILESNNGFLVQKIVLDSSYTYSYPIWLNDDNIAILAKKNQEFEIQQINLSTEKVDKLTEASPDHFSHLAVSNNHVFFSKSIRDVNNIFTVSVKTKKVFQVTDVAVSAFQPAISADGTMLAYSEFDASGYNVVQVPLEPREWQEVKSLKSSFRPNYIATLMAQERKNFLNRVPDESYEIKKFNTASGLIKPHSLLTNFYNGGFDVSILSDNVFSTLSADATASYNYNEDEWRYSVGLTYAELFPEISMRYQKANRSAFNFNYSAETDTSFIQLAYPESWSENRFITGVRVPLNFSSGQVTRSFNLIARYNYLSLSTDKNYLDQEIGFRDTIPYSSSFADPVRQILSEPIGDISFHAMDLILTGRISSFTARQNLGPKWGLSGFARYRKPFTNADIGGTRFRAGGTAFLPGAMRNHSLYLQVDFQIEDYQDQYRFSDNFIYPRGYDLSIRQDQYLKFGVNYAFPIWYPDIPIWGLAFIKRLKGTAFYDHGIMSRDQFPFEGVSNDMRSVGFELGIDFRAIRLLEIDLSLRYSYLLDDLYVRNSPHQFDFFVVSISQ